MRPKEPYLYVAALRPLSAYVALLKEAIAHNDLNAIDDLLIGYAVSDNGAYRIHPTQIHATNTTPRERT